MSKPNKASLLFGKRKERIEKYIVFREVIEAVHLCFTPTIKDIPAAKANGV
jgi:hypothetical protein